MWEVMVESSGCFHENGKRDHTDRDWGKKNVCVFAGVCVSVLLIWGTNKLVGWLLLGCGIK